MLNNAHQIFPAARVNHATPKPSTNRPPILIGIPPAQIPEFAHDSGHLSFRMGDHGAPTWDNQQFSWIEIELHSAHSGTIERYHPMLYRSELRMAESSLGIHGEWRYDEFTVTDEGTRD